MKKIVIANWKMNPQTGEEARKLFAAAEYRMHSTAEHVEAVICPPAIFLPSLSHRSHYAKLGAQNMSGHDAGAFTGEISAEQLMGWNVTHVILGHSERRIFFKETDEEIKEKIDLAIKKRLTPIVCLGGAKNAVEDKMKPIVTKQFNSAIKGLARHQIAKIIFAYEPTWAISSMQHSHVASGEHAQKLISHIRLLLQKHAGKDHAVHMPVIYGGTVNKANVQQFAKFPEISGALVGAASLDPDNFWEVIKEFSRESVHRL